MILDCYYYCYFHLLLLLLLFPSIAIIIVVIVRVQEDMSEIVFASTESLVGAFFRYRAGVGYLVNNTWF